MTVNGAVVVVTGQLDMLGRSLVSTLRSRGAQALNVGPPHYDLRRPREVRDMLRSIRPDAVIHVVQRAVDGVCSDAPRAVFDAVTEDMELIEACRVFGVKRLLHGETRWVMPRVHRALGPGDVPGARTPAAPQSLGLLHRVLDAQGARYRTQTSLDVSLLSLVNVYAADADYAAAAGGLVADLMSILTSSVADGLGEVQVWCDAAPTSPLLHVEDAARTLCDALESDGDEIPSLGGEVTLQVLAGAVAELVGFHGKISWATSGGALSVSAFPPSVRVASPELDRMRDFVAGCFAGQQAVSAAPPLRG